MSNITHLCRLLGGLLVLGLCCLAFNGCSDQTQTPAAGLTDLTATLPSPAPATLDDYTRALVKPSIAADAVATMTMPDFSGTNGITLETDGNQDALDLDLGNNGMATGSLPLEAMNRGISGRGIAVLSAGDHALSLTHGSRLYTKGVRVTSLRVLFTVHAGKPPSWTLPTAFKLDLQRLRHSTLHILNGSYLTLKWQAATTVAPLDGQVTITANLFDGNQLVAGPLTKTVTVANNMATFTGDSTVPFNRVTLLIDLRDVK